MLRYVKITDCFGYNLEGFFLPPQGLSQKTLGYTLSKFSVRIDKVEEPQGASPRDPEGTENKGSC
jgi:hypothetical protein